MKLIKKIYEEFKNCFEEFRDYSRCLGFWKTLRYDIEGAYQHNIGWVVRKIVKIIRWIPVLWDDEDYEYTYILKMLKYKLTRVKNNINKGYGDEEEWKIPRTKEIDEAIKSIDIILKDEFIKEERIQHEIKYGKIDWISKPAETVNGNQLHEMIIYYDKVKEDAILLAEAKDKFGEIYKLEDERRQQEYNKLFEGLAKNIQGWWD